MSTDKKNTGRKKGWNTVLNIVLIGLLLVLVVNPDAKSWILRQFVRTGIFNASIKKEPAKGAGLQPAADFMLTSVSGEKLPLSSLRGKIVFINFWASWCPPCRAEMPSLHNLYQRFRDDDRIVFLFVSEDDQLNTSAAYLQKNNWALPLYSRSGPVAPAIFSGTLPTTVILDKEGRVIYEHQGLAGYDSERFIQRLQSFL